MARTVEHEFLAVVRYPAKAFNDEPKIWARTHATKAEADKWITTMFKVHGIHKVEAFISEIVYHIGGEQRG